jgi:hypothetical protein
VAVFRAAESTAAKRNKPQMLEITTTFLATTNLRHSRVPLRAASGADHHFL